ncbi:ctp synthase-like protein [Trifolium pratense]|uniref:Ctp synthase-like protein n=1 Tax=Trifolium pratense TaxID=57577 RepID=A0A2K3N361_TRIPR|nr:ctp synthase-like protein [Trifolium pratense]
MHSSVEAEIEELRVQLMRLKGVQITSYCACLFVCAHMAQEPDLEEWTYRAEACDLLHEPVRIALVGKYTCLSDSYFSVPEALIDASVSCQNVDWISVAKNKRLKKFRDLISVS